MPDRPVFRVLLLLAVTLIRPSPTHAGLDRVGVEFQAHIYTQGDQRDARVAISPGHGFVVVWDQDDIGGFRDVLARRYDSSGNAMGAPFLVNLITANVQSSPAVATDADGDFVVTWRGYVSGPAGTDIFARRYDSSGVAIGGEIHVNEQTVNYQDDPAIAMSASGAFVVTWTNGVSYPFSLSGRRFDSAGSAQGGEFQPNTSTVGNRLLGDIAMTADGRFVVVWATLSAGPDSVGIYGQRFDAAGTPAGGEFHVNTFTDNIQTLPAVGIGDDGGFVVAWASVYQASPSTTAVFAQRFASGGAPVGVEFQVNAITTTHDNNPAVARSADGSFVIAWDSYASGSSVLARRFAATGLALGAPFLVKTYAPNKQSAPAIVVGGNDYVVVWTSEDQDGDDEGVFGQRFESVLTLDIDGDGTVAPLTDGLLFLRYGFGFRGAVLVGGAVGVGCTRCTAPEIEVYIAAQ